MLYLSFDAKQLHNAEKRQIAMQWYIKRSEVEEIVVTSEKLQAVVHFTTSF